MSATKESVTFKQFILDYYQPIPENLEVQAHKSIIRTIAGEITDEIKEALRNLTGGKVLEDFIMYDLPPDLHTQSISKLAHDFYSNQGFTIEKSYLNGIIKMRKDEKYYTANITVTPDTFSRTELRFTFFEDN